MAYKNIKESETIANTNGNTRCVYLNPKLDEAFDTYLAENDLRASEVIRELIKELIRE